MKNNILQNFIKYSFLFLAFLQISCNADIEDSSENYPQLAPLNHDQNAGSWQPILLSSANEFTIDAPAAETSSAYKLEINEIKSYQENLTENHKRIIKYWSVGGILRWNEIMQTLVARHNRPPYQNPDGTYPTPSGANPFANPQFPFANPPYAARAYAYVSAAQYDALVATHYYKQQFNRPAPFNLDANIQVLIPKSPLPSYPSEDGAIIGATVDILKLLFPTEIAFIQQKADEHKLYRILCGANVRSDIEAGENLGKKVAAKYTTRASTDGAGAAVGNQSIWTQLENNAINAGETPWKSLDLPARPPMLPLFGKVKSFLMTTQDIVDCRPVPPPSTSSALFKKELEEVKYYSQNTTRENMKIVTYWADGVGTYTPPGHWNAIAIKEFVNKNYSEVRWARNMAYLNLALMDAAISCWDAKYFYFNPRPSQMDPTIKTLTGIPNFPAYVSGHSTFSAAAAKVLSHFIPEKTATFQAMAKDASNSRLFGAIHYRSDCEKGLILGEKVANFAINKAQNDGAD